MKNFHALQEEISYKLDEDASTFKTGPGVTMTGIHYSNKPLTHLSGSHFGTGIKGQEHKRLTDKYEGATPEIKKRSYFYSVKPHENVSSMHEQGLGQEVHKAHLNNILDFDTAKPEETTPIHADVDKMHQEHGVNRSNALERALLNHGYKGYHSRGIIVALGHDSLPVQHLGKRYDLKHAA
jgi:hypothetical protein